jgi:hypothetical protein
MRQALTKVIYEGLPDLVREFGLDIKALRRMVDRIDAIKAIHIKDRIYIDMDSATAFASEVDLSHKQWLTRCVHRSRH